MTFIPKRQIYLPHVLKHTSFHQNFCFSTSISTHQSFQKLDNQPKYFFAFPTRKCNNGLMIFQKDSGNFQWICASFFSSSPIQSTDKQQIFKKSCFGRMSVTKHLPRPKPPWRVLFFGTDNFSLRMLKTLNENRLSQGKGRLVDTLEVVAIKANKKGSEVPVRRYAEEQGLRVLDWQPKLHPLTYDVGVLASFGFLIPSKVIDMFPYGILNVHPSLLPRWRGASPIEHTILYGDTETGISIMEIRPKHFDIGPILLQKQYSIPDRVTAPELRQIMAERGCNVMMEALSNLPELERRVVEQSEIGVTYAHKISRHASYVDWENQTYQCIDRQHRALHEIEALKTVFNKTKINLLDPCDFDVLNADSSVEEAVQRRFNSPSSEVPPGSLFYSKPHKLLLVKCRDGWTGFGSVIIRKRQSAMDFYCGYLQKNLEPRFQSLDNGIQFNLDLMTPRVLHSQTMPLKVREGCYTDLKVGHGS